MALLDGSGPPESDYETCPSCGSDEYGPLDLANPYGNSDLNALHYTVGVCLDCEFVWDSHEEDLDAAIRRAGAR